MTNNNQNSGSKNSTGTQGGTSKQHADAGRQSHKNDDKKSGSTSGSTGGNR